MKSLYIILSPFSDQSCRSVIQIRTDKPLQLSIFSTLFQMHDKSGTFNGVAMCYMNILVTLISH